MLDVAIMRYNEVAEILYRFLFFSSANWETATGTANDGVLYSSSLLRRFGLTFLAL
jgi:hypothetical protein